MTTPSKSRSRIPLGTRNQPEATRDTILRSAAAEFAMEGLAGARMDAIARSAGVNKALLYYYFHDKDALYGAVLDRFFGPLFLRLTGVLDSAAPAGNRILNYARAHFDTIAEAPHYARLFQGEMMSAGRGMSPHLSRIVEEYSRPLSLRMQATLKAGIAGGEFRQLDVLQFIPSMVATIVFYFVTAPVRRLLQGRSVCPKPSGSSRSGARPDRCRAVRRPRSRFASGSADCCRGRNAWRFPSHCRQAASSRGRPEAQMKVNRTLVFILVLVAAATAYYFLSTDRTSDTVLIGIVDANQVIVSSKIMGRIEKLYVDEGSKVKQGDLVAEIDSADLEAQRDSALAVITAYGSQVTSMRATQAQTVGETNSGVANAEARVAAAQAALAQAQADLARIQSDSQRTIGWRRRASPRTGQSPGRGTTEGTAGPGGERAEKRGGRQADLNTAAGSHYQQRAAASNVAVTRRSRTAPAPNLPRPKPGWVIQRFTRQSRARFPCAPRVRARW